MRKIKQAKRSFYKPKGEPTSELNCMEYYKIVEGVANKLNKERLTKQIVKEISNEVLTKECKQHITDEAVSGAIMVVANILLNHWKKLTPRDTRIKVMYQLFREIYDKAETPDEVQLAAEAEFERQTGYKVIRDKVT